jgi:hypothetical protein
MSSGELLGKLQPFFHAPEAFLDCLKIGPRFESLPLFEDDHLKKLPQSEAKGLRRIVAPPASSTTGAQIKKTMSSSMAYAPSGA